MADLSHPPVEFAHVQELLARMSDAGIRAGFFPGGDGAEPAGPYSSAVELLRDLGEMDHGLSAIGVGAYPEGHREIPEDVLLQGLLSKQAVATFMISEICFEPDQTLSWLRAIRESGIQLPLYVGAPGAVGMRKLMEGNSSTGAWARPCGSCASSTG